MRTCYEIYDMTLQDGTTLYDLLHYLQEQMEGMRYIEEKSTIAYEESEIPSYNEDVPPMVEEKESMVPEESVYYESSYEKILETIRAKGQHIKELILSWFAQNREVHGGKKDVLIEPEPIRWNERFFCMKKRHPVRDNYCIREMAEKKIFSSGKRPFALVRMHPAMRRSCTHRRSAISMPGSYARRESFTLRI